MKYLFISPIHNLGLEKAGIKVKLDKGVISNDQAIIKRTIKHSLLAGAMGARSIDDLSMADSFYYCEGELENSLTPYEIEQFGDNMAFSILREIQNVVHYLWLVRDNSVYVRDGFLFVFRNEKVGKTYKASVGAINTMASTKRETVLFSESEILAKSKDMIIYPQETVQERSQDFKEATQIQYFKSAKMERWSTAWFYVCFARSAAAIPVKILMYVTAMEALVTTLTTELSHQVSERMALLLGQNAEDKLAIYRDIKEAYGFRSKAAHGEAFKGTVDGIIPLLVRIDGYVRAMMNNEEFIKNEDVNSFFMNKLFG